MPAKIINGLKYNADIARLIGEYANSHDRRDFHQFEEALYCTPNGAYFLVGSGGPMSKYSRETGQNSMSGSDDNFTVLTKAEALDWCENHRIAADVIEREFADMLKDA
jgi:hypothetical protein